MLEGITVLDQNISIKDPIFKLPSDVMLLVNYIYPRPIIGHHFFIFYFYQIRRRRSFSPLSYTKYLLRTGPRATQFYPSASTILPDNRNTVYFISQLTEDQQWVSYAFFFYIQSIPSATRSESHARRHCIREQILTFQPS